MSRKRPWSSYPEFVPGDIAECNVDFYSTIPKGRQLRVDGTHHTNGKLVLDFVHSRYGMSSYFADNFINLSRMMPLFPPEKTMPIDPNKPIIAVEVRDEGIPFVGAVVDPDASKLQYSSLDDARRYLPPGKRWVLVQAVGMLEPEPPKPPYVFRTV